MADTHEAVAAAAGAPHGAASRSRCACLIAAGVLAVLYLAGVTNVWWPTPDSAAYLGLGRSLAEDLRAVGSGAAAERWLVAEALAYGPDVVAVRRGRWKLIAHRNGRSLGLYDLVEDPREHDDRQHRHPDLVRTLQAQITTWRRTVGDAASTGNAAGGWHDLDDEVRRRLKDLGYGE